MNKNKKALVPELRFPDFVGSGDWKKQKFDEVFEFLQNNTFSRIEMNSKSGKVRNIHYGDVLIKYGSILNDTSIIPYLNDDIVLTRFREESYVQNGDVIISDTAEDFIAGKTVEVQNINCNILAGLHTMLCRPKSKVAPKFFGYYLNSPSYHNNIVPLLTGTKVYSISKSNIVKTYILSPEFEEQQKIADCLYSLDELITAEDKKLNTLKLHKKSLMRGLFPTQGETVPALRFKEFRDSGDWEETTLGEICEIGSSKRVHASDWKTNGIPFYRARDIVAFQKKEHIDRLYISTKLYEKNIEISGEIKEGHLLVTGVGTIGVSYLVKKNDKFYFKDGNIIWLKNENKKVLSSFLSLLFHHEDIQKQIKTMSNVGTVATYTISNANQTSIFFSTIPEQQKIANCLSELDKLIDAQVEKIKKLKLHKKGLMQKLFPSFEAVGE